MRELNRDTALTLKYGIYLTILITTIGLLISFVDYDIGNKIMIGGIAALIAVPFVSTIVSAYALYCEKDMYWLKVSLLMIAISVVGMVVAYFV